nr:immunoglobulin heavy chain junction region [Macaca mulatta]MPN70379.1 immunoglobulin heavy chain junction region [Macaca mulatta]MPN71391.1 immunoglobulin heavy chain junction region [Macaca mulatta]MPN71844.1 immunoglobulin heavy chain junction region [Macaca mulatta]MPN72499.1 immunoglobulin heavy chain junction region [Macaca mulatta]
CSSGYYNSLDVW